MQSTNSGGFQIYAGFEGFRGTCRHELDQALQHGSVFLDANILLDLYAYPEPARGLALKYLASLGDRLFVPNQALREFWRNRHTKILAQTKRPRPLTAALQGINTIINELRPDKRSTPEVDEIKSTIHAQLELLQLKVDEMAGAPLDVDAILSDSSLDPVLSELAVLLEGKVLVGFPAEREAELIQEGLRRFDERQPPGYIDGPKKKDQIPERGTGDYLIWEQMLAAVVEQGVSSFVFVSNDEKEDWRFLAEKRIVGPRPELVSEALDRAKSLFHVVSPSSFYAIMGSLYPVEGADAEASALIASSEAASVQDVAEAGWSRESFTDLMVRLEDGGYFEQQVLLEEVISKGGFLSLRDCEALTGFSDAPSLRRLLSPLTTVVQGMIDEGVVDADVAPALGVVFDASGRVRGLEAPASFVDLESARSESSALSWLDAAVEVAREQPDRDWSVPELVQGVRSRGLRDLGSALTPEKTLARDLRYRDGSRFLALGGGRYRLVT